MGEPFLKKRSTRGGRVFREEDTHAVHTAGRAPSGPRGSWRDGSTAQRRGVDQASGKRRHQPWRDEVFQVHTVSKARADVPHPFVGEPRVKGLQGTAKSWLAPLGGDSGQT